MTGAGRARPLLFFCLAVPSAAQVEKYAGAWGLAAYAVAVVIALRWWPASIGEGRAARRGVVIVTCAAVALFLVAFPLANSGRFGPGSDTDEAYDLAVAALLDGRYPYGVETYLGNRVHHLPGALLMATPFVLLGSSAWQSLFWLPFFFVVARQELGGDGKALSLYAAVLLLSPVVLQQIVTGSDGVTNGLAVLVASWWVARATTGQRALATLIFALAMSNRPNFFLAVIPLWAYLARREGMAAGTRWLAATVGLVAAINLPFLLYDPAGFAPLEGANRVSRFDDLIPHSGVVLTAAGIAIAGVLSLRVHSVRDVFATSAVTQAFFVVSGLVLSSIQSGRLELAFAGYGPFFLFSGALASWPGRLPTRRVASRHMVTA